MGQRGAAPVDPPSQWAWEEPASRVRDVENMGS